MKQYFILIILISLVLIISFTASAQWVQIKYSYTFAINCLLVSGENVFVGTDGGGICRSTLYDTSWTIVNTGLASLFVKSFVAIPNNVTGGMSLFAGTYGGVYLSTNNGTNWTAVNTGLTNTIVLSLIVSDTVLFAGTVGGVFLSIDNGANWTAINTGLTNIFIQSLALCGTNLFAGTGSGLFQSTNNGLEWTVCNTGLTGYVLSLSCLTNNYASDTILVAGTSGGVFLSNNNSINWTDANNGLTELYIRSLVISDTNIFVSTSGNIFLSSNIGKSWRSITAGLPYSIIGFIAIFDKVLFAWTNGGIWKRPLSEIISSVEQKSFQIPEEFSLSQNYPNPFNPSTTIKFQIPISGFVTLKIFDMLGKEVATLVNEKLSLGSYEKTYDASGLASGVYLYQLKAGGFIQIKKLLLLK
jgi:photosystem II stability/assembly factor-like uncharacterized protein